MKSIIATMAILALCGCEPATPERVEAVKARYPFTGVEAYHDDVRSVTCWTTSRGGLSCIPDWMLASQKSSEPDRCLVKDVGKSEACRKMLAKPAEVSQ